MGLGLDIPRSLQISGLQKQAVLTSPFNESGDSPQDANSPLESRGKHETRDTCMEGERHFEQRATVAAVIGLERSSISPFDLRTLFHE